jgi:hypothetical protein
MPMTANMNSMCTRILSISLLSIFFIIGLPPQKAMAQAEGAYASYNDFYQNLAPYGQWIEEPKYGYVWSPDVNGDFRPYYTNGHWVMTDYGNTWLSGYPWGWACFHYGRWTYDSYYGWIWIPGTNWGPAWVSWREGGGVYGWSPLSPDSEFGASVGDYHCPNDWWVFIPQQYIYESSYYRYYYGPHGNNSIIKNTSIIKNNYENENNHVTYVMGPRGTDIQQITHHPVQIYKLSSSANLVTKEHNGIIKMYRPAEIKPVGTINGERVIPPNVVAAPQPLARPQPINQKDGQYAAPEFRYDVPRTTHNETVGNHVVEAEKLPAQQRNTTSNYEYDVNRPLTQPTIVPQRAAQPVPQPRQQPAQDRPQPAPQQRPARRATESDDKK